jgi:hypothetical protein
VAIISTLQASLLRADAAPYERILALTEADGLRFARGIVIGLTISGFFYAGLGALLVSLWH